jgi:putative ABC transport system permease protein
MVSTLTKKAWNDLSRRKARTVFTVLTVALAVGSLGLLFVSPMMDRAMSQEVQEGRLHNLRFMLANASLNDSDVEALEAIENVLGVEAHKMFLTKVKVGPRTCAAVIIGVDSFSDQKVDRIFVLSGRAPAVMEVLGDASNAKYTAFSAGEGGTATVLDASGRQTTFNITGAGRSLQFSVYAQYIGAVFYATSETVRVMAGPATTTFLDVDLAGDSDREISMATSAVGARLAQLEPGAVLRATPESASDDKWPGKEGFGSMMAGFSIITYLALLTGVVLISNTMNTTMLEQTREIGCLKAVGATRGQVARLYITMAAIIGALGSAAGIALGIIIGNWMCQVLGPILGITPGLDVYLPGLLISFAAGVGLSVAAAAPALWRGIRLGTREALDESTSGYKGAGRLMRALTGSRGVPRTVQMGSRNVGRNTGRSAATVLQLALAVATLLSIASIGSSVQASISSAFDDMDYDMEVTSQGGLGTLDPSVGERIMAIPGVSMVEPYSVSNFKLAGEKVAAFGLPSGTKTHVVRITEGRWFSQSECSGAQQVAVISTSLSKLKGIPAGGDVKIETPAGLMQFKVVGLTDTIIQMGRVVYVPMPTMQSLMGMGTNVSGFAVKLASHDHGSIDAAATEIQSSLEKKGFLTEVTVMYILERQNVQGFMDVMNMIQGLGFMIVLISMVGLANNLTMNVLERTREIGIMRCIGAGAGSIRAVFSSEGLMLMVAGWALGIPLGFALGWSLFEMFTSSMAVSMPFVFPAAYALIALVAVVGVGALVIQVPITRAVRIPPGDALRYQ